MKKLSHKNNNSLTRKSNELENSQKIKRQNQFVLAKPADPIPLTQSLLKIISKHVLSIRKQFKKKRHLKKSKIKRAIR
jgi:hypothetical protein